MKFHCAKIIKLKNADIHLHYANNKGRGRDNVTVTFVTTGVPRPAVSSGYEPNTILKQYRVSGWAGNVNVPSGDIKTYGGLI